MINQPSIRGSITHWEYQSDRNLKNPNFILFFSTQYQMLQIISHKFIIKTIWFCLGSKVSNLSTLLFKKMEKKIGNLLPNISNQVIVWKKCCKKYIESVKLQKRNTVYEIADTQYWQTFKNNIISCIIYLLKHIQYCGTKCLWRCFVFLMI